MKTFLIVLTAWTIFFIYACNKNDKQQYGREEGCNCGMVCEDGIDLKSNSYWLLVENECTGSQKRFSVDKVIWGLHHQGDRICINNALPW